MDSEGNKVKWKLHQEDFVPDEPQEAAYAEPKALVRATQLTDGPAVFWSDCAAMVKNAARGKAIGCVMRSMLHIIDNTMYNLGPHSVLRTFRIL